MLKSVALSAGLIAGANAFWRMECPGRVGLARMDPIINPNEASPHAHTIHGSDGFSESATTADLLDGDCTSCRVTQDKSAYWTPTIYFQDAKTEKFEIVPQVGGMLAYYLLYGDNITAFPPGFQMISGDNDRRNYTLGDARQPDPDRSQWAALGQTTQEALAQRAIGFNCLNYATKPEQTLYRHYLPPKAELDQNCTDGVRFEIMFPSCWKGGNAIDSEDHKSHMAFPDQVMTGTCPEGYPVRTPSILYETIWNTYAFKNRDGRFVVSNGDTTGYGYHGDFMTGWDPEFLQKAINQCTNLSGLIQDCPIFDVVDKGEATSCKIKKPLLKALFAEDVVGPMANLPGGIKVGQVGSGDHGKKPAAGSKPAASSSASSSAQSPVSKPSAVVSPLPGLAFKENAPSSSSVPSPTTTSATPPPPPPTTPSVQPSYYSTEYITNGNQVTQILWVEKWVTVTDYGNSPAPTPARAHDHRRRHMRHGHVHGKF
ncbi:hypothetical protein MHUMG1_03999 [Metarhizium humberi]|uniref:DUF1996 domain-containing protein n=1 Tax=Metarhizium humberi TaxID=2596975 RepID=A0A9P8MDD5_9HYPO|nr:hypothetical protein MHUMG1_03999 [Metarhizium humberi]